MRRLRRSRSLEQSSPQRLAIPALYVRPTTPQTPPPHHLQPTSENTGPPHGEENPHKWGTETVRILQSVAEMASGPVGLAGVSGLGEGLAVLATGLQKILDMQANVKGIEKLKVRVTDLEANVAQICSRSDNRQLPGDRQREIKELAKKWSEIGQRADKIARRWKLVRFFTSGADMKELEGLVAELTESIADSITMNGILSIEGYVAAFAEDLGTIKRTVDGIETHLMGPVITKYAQNAQFFSGDTRQQCLEGTRVEILDRVDTWIDTALNHKNGALYWINGNPGTGKTTIACTIAQKCKNRRILAANFFCSRSDAECSDADLIFPTIARQLCHFHPPFKAKVEDVLKEDPDIMGARLPEQFEKLIVTPLEAVKGFPKSVIIFDALDECNSTEAAQIVLLTIARFIHRIGEYVSFIATSRPEPYITHLFKQDSLNDVTTTLILHEVPQDQVLGDIEHYVDHEFESRVGRFNLGKDWPSTGEKNGLVRQSEGLFVYVKTAIDFILDEAYGDPPGQFQSLVPTEGQPRSPESGEFLCKLYTRIVVASHDKTKQMKPKLVKNLRDILGLIAVAQNALPVVALARFLCLQENTIRSLLSGLHSVLAVPSDNRQPIRTLHSTFPEFLLQSPPTVCPDSGPSLPPPLPTEFHVQSAPQHQLLFSRCLEAMGTLKHDMIGIRHPAKFKSEIGDFEKRVDDAIELHVRYACRYWDTHLRECLGSVPDADVLKSLLYFLEHSLLYWIEACSLLGIADKVVDILVAARKPLQTLGEPSAEILSLLADGLRFALAYLPCIHAAPLAVYYSALSLCPTQSAIYTTYTEKPKHALVVPHGVPSQWESLIDKFSLPEDKEALSVAIHPNGSSFVTGWFGQIVIWNTYARTKALSIRPTERPISGICSIAFSPDGLHIASGTELGSISIWQASSGECIHSWDGKGSIGSIAYSAKGDRLLSTTDNGVALWDTSNWRCLVTLYAQISNRAAISPDGQTIAYGGYGCAHLYDVPSKSTRALDIPTQYTRFLVRIFAFSPCGEYVGGVADGRPGTVLVWKSSDMSLVRFVESSEEASFYNCCLAFSPDSAHIACGSDYGSIILFDVMSQEPLRTLEGDEEPIFDLAWSPDGVLILSVGRGGVQMWDIANRFSVTATDEHFTSSESPPPPPSHPFHFAHVQCRCGSDDCSDLHNDAILHLSSLGIDVTQFTVGSQMPDDAPSVTLVAEAPTTSPGFLRSSDWEFMTGRLPSGFTGYRGAIKATISSDGSLMAYSHPKTMEVIVIRIPDGTIVSSERAWHVSSIAFSPDATRLGTCSNDGELIVRDVVTGDIVCRHTGISRWFYFAFSSDGSLVAGASLHTPYAVHVLDVTARSVKILLSSPSELDHSSVAFADDNARVLVLDNTSRGYIFDVATGTQLHSFGCTNSIIESVWPSADDTGIVCTDDEGNTCKLALWKPGSRIWPHYHITQDGWVFAARPGKKERLCWIPIAWRDTLGWNGRTTCAFREKEIEDGSVVLGKEVVLDFGPLLDGVGFWNDQ